MSKGLPSQYLHGTAPDERDRLLRLNELINPSCLEKIRLLGGERVLEVGSGLGVFARDMARASGGGPVVCVERDDTQIYRSLEMAERAGEGSLLDLRQGDVSDLPLEDDEWGTFDVVHCRFVLEHLPHPQSTVESMGRALRAGGRLILSDDDHDLMRLWPAIPAVDELWRALIHAFTDQGKDPFVGRKLVTMMRVADLEPTANDLLFFGGCAGAARWDGVLENLLGVLMGARPQILQTSAITGSLFDEVIERLLEWGARPDASIWYPICWAEAVRPA